MDGAYQGDATLNLARQLGYQPVVPPNPQRRTPWEYDRALYRRRNEIERLFRRLKGYRRVFCRFDKLDVVFAGFIVLALIVEALRN
jgi:transposase